jgi:glycosyltransferase involved in cell wall biosynthesis
MVTYEALAAGLPVITTPNAGSVVRDGVEGFIVPIRNPESLAEKIDLLARNPELLAQMSQKARERAQEFSWAKYGERLVDCIKERFPYE